MTKPTQAQIEAAAKSLRDNPNVYAFGPRLVDIAKDALIAAAQVGEPTTSLLSTAIENVKAETIERCAAVADDFIQQYGDAHIIAAAIRALKDKPNV